MSRARVAIINSIDSGTFAELLVDWDVDDLSLLAMELKRGEVIAEIVDADETKIVDAIERLGWEEMILGGLEKAEHV